MISRQPCLALRPFVKRLWISDTTRAASTRARERVLPTGDAHVVFRLTDTPLKLFADESDPQGQTIGCAVVGGPRAAHYVRAISEPVRSIGAQLHPGAAELLFSVPADELADRHTPLDQLWGAARVTEIRERLSSLPNDDETLALFESILAARLPRVRGLHPAIAHALSRFRETDAIREVVEESGLSHRRFIVLFRRSVGLSPKIFCRVRRFQRALELGAGDPSAVWVELAIDAGYSDQPHFAREFREMTGLSPSEYRRISPEEANHVPVFGAPVNSVQDPGGLGGHSDGVKEEDDE